MRPLWTHQGQRKICDAMVLILGLTPVLLQVDFLDCDHIIDIAAQPQFVTRIRCETWTPSSGPILMLEIIATSLSGVKFIIHNV